MKTKVDAVPAATRANPHQPTPDSARVPVPAGLAPTPEPVESLGSHPPFVPTPEQAARIASARQDFEKARFLPGRPSRYFIDKCNSEAGITWTEEASPPAFPGVGTEPVQLLARVRALLRRVLTG